MSSLMWPRTSLDLNHILDGDKLGGVTFLDNYISQPPLDRPPTLPPGPHGVLALFLPFYLSRVPGDELQC